MRAPAVAGTFYPAAADTVAVEATKLLVRDDAAGEPVSALAIVCPHAGWKYSGALAGRLIAGVQIPERVVVLAPNHTGNGPRASIWPAAHGGWRLPGGDVAIDAAFAQQLTGEAPILRADEAAHEDEHAIEVILPLLRARQASLRIVPIVLAGLSFDECEELGGALARVIARTTDATLIVASSDMSHYLPDDETRARDRKALAPLTELDARGLWNTVRGEGITMCGYVPATVALLAARALGAKRAHLIGYATSADAGGERDRVVGYAAVSIV